MQKMFLLSFVLVAFLSGCLARTYSIQKERVDQSINGNCGYILGKPSEKEKQPPLKTHRQINVLEVELGSHDYGKNSSIK